MEDGEDEDKFGSAAKTKWDSTVPKPKFYKIIAYFILHGPHLHPRSCSECQLNSGQYPQHSQKGEVRNPRGNKFPSLLGSL